MTYTIARHETQKHQITITQDKYSALYHVSLLEMMDACRATEVKRNSYTTKAKAQQRFNYLKRQVKEMEG